MTTFSGLFSECRGLPGGETREQELVREQAEKEADEKLLAEMRSRFSQYKADNFRVSQSVWMASFKVEDFEWLTDKTHRNLYIYYDAIGNDVRRTFSSKEQAELWVASMQRLLDEPEFSRTAACGEWTIGEIEVFEVVS